MVWCMKTVLKIAELPECPTPAQGGWENEQKRDEQWSPVDLCTKEHCHLIHMGATSFEGPSALRHYSKSGVLPSPYFQVSFDFSHPRELLWLPNSILSGLLKNSRRAPKYATKTVREIWKGGFAKIFTM